MNLFPYNYYIFGCKLFVVFSGFIFKIFQILAIITGAWIFWDAAHGLVYKEVKRLCHCLGLKLTQGLSQYYSCFTQNCFPPLFKIVLMLIPVALIGTSQTGLDLCVCALFLFVLQTRKPVVSQVPKGQLTKKSPRCWGLPTSLQSLSEWVHSRLPQIAVAPGFSRTRNGLRRLAW